MRQRLRLAILECDTPLPNTAQRYGGGYGGVFKALLNKASQAEGHGEVENILDISTYQIEQEGATYPDLDKVDALLLTGSRHDSFADSPWILKLVKYTAEAIKTKRLRIIGVCFGHQIIARAMGVEVGRNANGWEAAVNDVQLSKKGQALFEVENLRIHQMHRDMVYTYPPNVQDLGSSPVCSTQGMYTEGQLITVQGHPEFNSEIMKEIIDTRHATGIFDDGAYKEHARKVALPHDGIIVGRAFIRFLLQG